MTRVLVTGVGAVIGYGILRSLRNSGCHLIGMDIYADAYGQHLCDTFVQAVRSDDPGYPDFLEQVIQTQRPDLVVPGIEQDVTGMDGLRDLFARLDVRCALNQSELIALAADKWAFHLVERRSGLEPIPSSIAPEFADLEAELGLPFLLKPRRGYASKGIVEITSESAFVPYASDMGQRYLAQRKVGDTASEYTVGAFGDGRGGFSAQIQMRRLLSGEGATAKAWVVKEDGLTERIAAYCATFQPLGPTNLQFRRTDSGWALLEINPRISSATSLRTAFGYNEALMTLQYYLKGETPSQPRIRGGHAVRFIEDFVTFDDRTYF